MATAAHVITSPIRPWITCSSQHNPPWPLRSYSPPSRAFWPSADVISHSVMPPPPLPPKQALGARPDPRRATSPLLSNPTSPLLVSLVSIKGTRLPLPGGTLTLEALQKYLKEKQSSHQLPRSPPWTWSSQ